MPLQIPLYQNCATLDIYDSQSFWPHSLTELYSSNILYAAHNTGVNFLQEYDERIHTDDNDGASKWRMTSKSQMNNMRSSLPTRPSRKKRRKRCSRSG